MADTVVLPRFEQFAGLGLGAENFVAQFLQQRRQQQAAQQLQGLGLPGGLTAPFAQQFAAQQALGQQDIAGRMAVARAKPATPVSGSFQQITDPATGQQINALVNPRTGNIIRKFSTVEEGLSAKDKTTIAVTQAKEFRADPRIENLGIVERSERGMAAALNQAKKGGKANRIASDQALGVLFQKMLDPTSVVRESEFARTPQGAAMVNRITGSIKQLTTGGLGLEDEDREALVDMAQRLLREAKISANRAFDEFTIRADTIGLNKKIVFGGAKKFDIPLTELESIEKQIAEIEAKVP